MNSWSTEEVEDVMEERVGQSVEHFKQTDWAGAKPRVIHRSALRQFVKGRFFCSASCKRSSRQTLEDVLIW